MSDQSSGSTAQPIYHPREVSHIHDIATGAVEGGVGVLATEPLLAHLAGETIENPFRGGWRGTGQRIGAGAVVGGAATGLIGALVSHAESKRKAKLRAQQMAQTKMSFRPGMIELAYGDELIADPTARKGVRLDHYQKNIAGREIDRAINDHLRVAAAGAIAGAVIPHPTASILKRAGVGAAGGVGLLTAIRALAHKDVYGDTSPGAKETQSYVAPAIAVGGLGYGATKRYKAASERIKALRIHVTGKGAAAKVAKVTLSCAEDEILQFARSLDDDEVKKKPFDDVLQRAAIPAAVAAGSGALTYGLLRRRSSLPENAPARLKVLRKAAERYGMARVAVHEGSNVSGFRKAFTEVMQPADYTRHIASERAYGAKKFKGAIFDPEETGRLEGGPQIGYHDKVSRQIEKGKLEEYHVATAAGLEMPHTAPLMDAKTIEPDYVAKPARGSQSKSVVTKEMIDKHDPNDPLLAEFKKFQKDYSSKIKNEDSRAVAENSHPGYKAHMTEQAIQHPENFVKQKKIDIAEEYRVHAIGGQAIKVTSGRFGLSTPLAHREAEAAAEAKLVNVHPKLKDNLLALDLAKDTTGNWHVIETNPGPGSGFLTPENKLDARGPHGLYKQITGRYARSTSALAGAGVAAGAGVGTLALTERDKQRRIRQV
jgi:hypothetical protein